MDYCKDLGNFSDKKLANESSLFSLKTLILKGWKVWKMWTIVVKSGGKSPKIANEKSKNKLVKSEEKWATKMTKKVLKSWICLRIQESCYRIFLDVVDEECQWFTNTGTIFLTLNISPFFLYKISFAMCSRKETLCSKHFHPPKIFL